MYQTTDVAYLSDWGLQMMSIGTRLFSMKDPHKWAKPPAMVTIPNTKAMIEKVTGRRLWMRLFVRP